jgi:hypothetical protein
MIMNCFLRLIGLGSLLLAVPALAAIRTLTLAAPATAQPGASIEVVVTATTDAKDSEHIGFLHAEYSVDGGKTWVPVYEDNLGRTHNRMIPITAGAAGTKVVVRARAAFRGGKAGDVDFTGAPIAWDGSWDKWHSPPAREVTVTVGKR